MKPEKIDLTETYPCPRCKRGEIKAIILTEAFGCDRCNQIFGLFEENYTLEQLSTSYPYKKAWQWTGGVWQDDSRTWDGNYIPALVLVLVIPFMVMVLPTAFGSTSNPSPLLYALIFVTPVTLLWMISRQRR
jgi:uncharacterized protein (DUF983 family)